MRPKSESGETPAPDSKHWFTSLRKVPESNARSESLDVGRGVRAMQSTWCRRRPGRTGLLAEIRAVQWHWRKSKEVVEDRQGRCRPVVGAAEQIRRVQVVPVVEEAAGRRWVVESWAGSPRVLLLWWGTRCWCPLGVAGKRWHWMPPLKHVNTKLRSK